MQSCASPSVASPAPRSYAALVHRMLGPRWGIVMSLTVLAYSFGSCIAYLVITGEQGEQSRAWLRLQPGGSTLNQRPPPSLTEQATASSRCCWTCLAPPGSPLGAPSSPASAAAASCHSASARAWAPCKVRCGVGASMHERCPLASPCLSSPQPTLSSAAVSSVCLAGLVAVAGIVVLRSAQILAAPGYSWSDVRAFNTEADLVQGLGALVIIIFGFHSHTNVITVFDELEREPVLLFRGSLSSSAASNGEPLGEAAAAAADAAETGGSRGVQQRRRRPKTPKLAGMVRVVLAALAITGLLYTTVGAPAVLCCFVCVLLGAPLMAAVEAWPHCVPNQRLLMPSLPRLQAWPATWPSPPAPAATSS